jgi:hypothetical protein
MGGILRYVIFSWCPLLRSRLNTPCKPSSSSSCTYCVLKAPPHEVIRIHGKLAEFDTLLLMMMLAFVLWSAIAAAAAEPVR